VTTLSVEVPAEVAISVSEDGADQIAGLLSEIPPTAIIWNADSHLVPRSRADRLYWLLHGRRGMGRTTTSKLLAAKRPGLIPIWDDQAGQTIASRDANYWQLWAERCASPRGDELRLVASVVNATSEPNLELLRAIDIVVDARLGLQGFRPSFRTGQTGQFSLRTFSRIEDRRADVLRSWDPAT
jgi:Family of unknown function (DUF6308)